MNVFLVAAAAFVLHVTKSLYDDSNIRSREYSTPLSTIPENADNLAQEMIDAEAAGKNLTPQQIKDIEIKTYKILSEGAVLQRNQELSNTRELISYYGQFLSWFMKAKGLTYSQIQAKYLKDFSARELEMHKKIIESASSPNKDLLNKFLITIQKKFGFIQSKL